eukprot:m.225975 g.225975  ORF g.225975 m.225975 type:complete len:349 (+) comp25920_c0_seq4:71-1117(+)
MASAAPTSVSKLGNDRMLYDETVTRVAVVGGTHGNEATGVALATHYLRNPVSVQRPSFETSIVIGNPAAVKANRRYVDKDLNRCFLASDLAEYTPANGSSTIEVSRAAEINALLGPKLNSSTDFILDCHTTTAATGLALMMAPDDALALEVAAFLQSQDGSVRIVLWSLGHDWPMLPSIGRCGMTVEVGPVSIGCCTAAVYTKMHWAVQTALDYIDCRNTSLANGAVGIDASVQFFSKIGTVDYPRHDDGTVCAMVHEDLQGQDFAVSLSAQPVFRKMSGEAMVFDLTMLDRVGGPVSVDGQHAEAVDAVNASDLVPFFVNESAYYEKGIAFAVAQLGTTTVRVFKGL